MINAVSFDDVLITPTGTTIESRLSVSTNVKIAGCELSTPLISAPMDTVTNDSFAIQLGLRGGMGIIHRFATDQERMQMILNVARFNSELYDSGKIPLCFAIGASEKELGFFFDAVEAVSQIGEQINAVCIDVANGHSTLLVNIMRQIKSRTNVNIIAGSTATRDGYMFLVDNGADAVRVGIGGGSICKTRIQTGIGVPTLQSVLWSFESLDNVPIIADGGIRYPADLCKSLIAGASAVMCGNIFAATPESAGHLTTDDQGNFYKMYRGMASAEVQIEKRNGLKPGTVAEGVSTLLKIDTSKNLDYVVNEFTGGLKSSMTYVNAQNLDQYIGRQELLIRISTNGLKESHAFGTQVHQ